MIVAGEASGDLHGARFVSAVKDLCPEVSFSGIGGDSMKSEGVELLYHASKIAVVGLIEVFSHLKDIWQAMRALKKRMQDRPPTLLVLIDFPDFNLILAKKAKGLGVPILYYISPQVWAWRTGRAKKISRLVDRMAVILPFVGHPLLDSVHTEISKSAFRKQYRIPEGNSVVGIFPGSRKKRNCIYSSSIC